MKCDPCLMTLAAAGAASPWEKVSAWVHRAACRDCRAVYDQAKTTHKVLRREFHRPRRFSSPRLVAYAGAALVLTTVLAALGISSFREARSHRSQTEIRNAAFAHEPMKKPPNLD